MARASKGSRAGGRKAASTGAGRRGASRAASGPGDPSGRAVEKPLGGKARSGKPPAGHVSPARAEPDVPAGTNERDEGVGSFVRGLTETERVALIVRDELYGGSWESYRKDVEAKAAGRPYVFKLASRIEDDLKAVEKLRRFEQRHEVNLADYLGEGR